MPVRFEKTQTVVLLGEGDVVVAKGTQIGKEKQDSVFFIPSNIKGKIGDYTPLFDGVHTDELPPYAVLVFDSTESIQVVIDALEDIKKEKA